MHGMISVEMNAMHIKIFIEYHVIHEIIEGVPIKCDWVFALLLWQYSSNKA